MANEKLLIDLQSVNMDEVDTSDCTDIEDILSAVITYLSELPIVDAVEVVRCKDCKHFKPGLGAEGIMFCKRDKLGRSVFMRNDDFCSYGERKTNAEKH